MWLMGVARYVPLASFVTSTTLTEIPEGILSPTAMTMVLIDCENRECLVLETLLINKLVVRKTDRINFQFKFHNKQEKTTVGVWNSVLSSFILTALDYEGPIHKQQITRGFNISHQKGSQ
jgi:hypothetical protein